MDSVDSTSVVRQREGKSDLKDADNTQADNGQPIGSAPIQEGTQVSSPSNKSDLTTDGGTRLSSAHAEHAQSQYNSNIATASSTTGSYSSSTKGHGEYDSSSGTYDKCKLRGLVHRKDLPKHLQFNPYIDTGYRPLLSAWECILSLFYIHNETVNIITHGEFMNEITFVETALYFIKYWNIFNNILVSNNNVENNGNVSRKLLVATLVIIVYFLSN